MAEDVLDFALDSGLLGNAGRDIDIALQVGGNALGTGALCACLMTTMLGGVIMAAGQREEGEGGGTAATIYICAALASMACLFWLIIMLLIAYGKLTEWAVRIITKLLGHLGHFMDKLVGADLRAFARATVAEWFNHAMAVVIGVICIFGGIAVSAMTDKVKEEYKSSAQRDWVTMGVITMWFGIALGGFHIFLVIT